MKNEPVLTAVTAFVVATIGLLVAFGVDLSSEQIAAIVGWVAAAYGLALLVRSKVTPVDKTPRVAHMESRRSVR